MQKTLRAVEAARRAVRNSSRHAPPAVSHGTPRTQPRAHIPRGERNAHVLHACPRVGKARSVDTMALSPMRDSHMATVTDTSAQERWEKENAAAPMRKEPPTTVSQRSHRGALYARRSARFRSRHRSRLSRPISVHARRSCLHVSLAGSGPCGNSPASAPPATPMNASNSSSARGRPASPPLSICRRSWASTPTIHARSAKSAGSASPSIRSMICRCSSTASIWPMFPSA